MASVLDTLRIIFGAEWQGAGAIQKMNADLARSVQGASQVRSAIENMSRGSGAAMDRIPLASAKAVVQLQFMRAESQRLQDAMGRLGEKVRSGAMTIDQAAAKYKQYGEQLRVVQGGLDKFEADAAKADRANQGFIQRMGGWPGVIAAGTAAFLGARKAIDVVVDGLRKVAEIAEEGAGIAQLEISFERLSQGILGVPDLLGQMREAARGTITDVNLMSSFLTVAAGTSGDFGKSLADNTPKLIEIAKAANILNPTLGNTEFFFESLAKGIKRMEFRLIDNLGLNVRVRQANIAYAESIGKTVLQLTAEERQIAFLNEVLRVGSLLTQQVAGDTESLLDPYQQLTVALENTRNEFKKTFALGIAEEMKLLGTASMEGAEGVDVLSQTLAILASTGIGGILADINKVGLAFKDIGKARVPVETTESIINMALALRSLLSLRDDAFNFGTAFGKLLFGHDDTNTAEIINAERGLVKARDERARAARNAAGEELRLLNTARGSVDWMARLEERETGTILTDVQKKRQEEQRKFVEEQEKLQQELLDALQETFTGEITGDIEFAGADFDPLRDNLARAMADIRDDLAATRTEMEASGLDAERMGEVMAEAGEVSADAFDNMREQAAAARQEFLDIIASTREDMRSALVIPEGAISVKISGGAEPWQTDALERYEDALKSTGQELFDHLSGFKIAGDTAEEQQEKIAELRAEMVQYQTAIANLGITEAQYSTVHRALAVDMDNLNNAFFDQLVAAGVGQRAITDYGVELGKFTEEEAEAAWISQLLQEKMGVLARKVAEGDLTVEQARTQLSNYADTLSGVREIVTDIPDHVVAMREELANDIEIGVTSNVEEEVGHVRRSIEELLQTEYKVGIGVDFTDFQGLAREVGMQEALAMREELNTGLGDTLEVDLHVNPELDDARRAREEMSKQLDPVMSVVPYTVDALNARATLSKPFDAAWTVVPYTAAAQRVRDELSRPISVPVTYVPQNSPTVPPQVPEYAHGGYVGGQNQRGGAVPAIVHEGEYVLSRNAVNALGRGFLDRLNDGGSPGNNVSITLNNYGQMGATTPAPAGSSNQAWGDLAEILRRYGVQL
jgi:hypothetical protein